MSYTACYILLIMTRRKFLNKLKKANVNIDDWACDLIESIENDYARGRLESYLSEYNSKGGEMNEELKEELKEVSYYFDWN